MGYFTECLEGLGKYLVILPCYESRPFGQPLLLATGPRPRVDGLPSINEVYADDNSLLLAVFRLIPSLVAIERGTGVRGEHCALEAD